MSEALRRRRFSPGGLSPTSGVYRIFHLAHRAEHEAAMLAGERFPRCRACGDEVRFELVVATKGSAATRGQNPSVLIASHERGAAGRLRSWLRGHGYFVSIASDAATARERLQQSPCDALIANLDLEHSRSGLEIARFASQLVPKPVVFVYTCAPTTDTMREILRSRVDYCVLEPLNANEVTCALETLMARRTPTGMRPRLRSNAQ